jgi:hypothetical protein
MSSGQDVASALQMGADLNTWEPIYKHPWIKTTDEYRHDYWSRIFVYCLHGSDFRVSANFLEPVYMQELQKNLESYR